MTGLLERHPEHRMIVHDWGEHADKAVKQLLKGRQEGFVCPHVYTCGQKSALPEPEPEPEPVLSFATLTPASEPPPRPTELGFDRFWAAYPKKRHKPAAARAWKAMDGARHLEAVVAGVDAWKRSKAWLDGFVEDPATFLRQRQWEDAVSTEASTKPTLDDLHAAVLRERATKVGEL